MSEQQGVSLVNYVSMRIAFAVFIFVMNLIRGKWKTVILVIIQACLCMRRAAIDHYLFTQLFTKAAFEIKLLIPFPTSVVK
jgi:hypothetical protein